MDELANIIKSHRKKAGLTQKQLAVLAGVGKSVVFDIEKGKSSIRLNTLTAVLRALNIELMLSSPLISAKKLISGRDGAL